MSACQGTDRLTSPSLVNGHKWLHEIIFLCIIQVDYSVGNLKGGGVGSTWTQLIFSLGFGPGSRIIHTLISVTD